MCHFVLTALPPNAKLDAIRPIAKSFARPLTNANIEIRGLSPSRPMLLYYTTKHCDCGTAIGGGAGRAHGWSPSESELRRRRRRGWSEAKIGRWVEEHRKTEERREAKAAELERRSLPEIQQWLAFAGAALDSGATSRFGLVLAWSPGESIEIEDEVRTSIGAATPLLLYGAREHVLYTFTPGNVVA